MKKPKVVFVCQECGYDSPKWMGQCICGEWNTFVEEKVVEDNKNQRAKLTANNSKPVPISEISSELYERVNTGVSELDRVLGGGLVKGSLSLISGEPGIGKSTLILQAAYNIAKNTGEVLYITGEESVEQIRIRADRIKAINNNLFIISETDAGRVVEFIEEQKPAFVIIDSIQTLFSNNITSAPGSVSQVRECTNHIMRVAKTLNIPVFIVAHVTKNGDLAGPRTMEHLVDTVLAFTGERNQEVRILRAPKNRYGNTSEIGAFEMKENGLIELDNLSQSFLEGMSVDAEGAIATASYEGSRPLLLEMQALVVPANIGFARRSTIGIEQSRMNMIVAVLEKKAGLSLLNYDIYINIVGGLKPEGTSTDLAVALAIYSSYRSINVKVNSFIAIGELGLTGEVRPVLKAENIIKEAARMGFEKVIMPKKNAIKIDSKKMGIQVVGIETIADAIKELDKQ